MLTVKSLKGSSWRSVKFHLFVAGTMPLSHSPASSMTSQPLTWDHFVTSEHVCVYLRRMNSCTKALASRPPVLMRVLEKTNPGPDCSTDSRGL